MALNFSGGSAKRLVELLYAYRDEDPDAVYFNVLDADNDWLILPRTRSDLLNDATRTANKLLQTGSLKRQPGEPLVKCAILGRSGYGYFIHFVAAMLNGWTPVVLSPRNSFEGTEELIRLSESEHLIIDEASQVNIDVLSKKIPGVIMHRMETAQPDGQHTTNEFKQNAWTDEQYKAEMHLPGWYVHTSGSTGHPKLIPWSHQQIHRRMQDLSKTKYEGRFMIATLPMFHAVGVTVGTMWPICTGAVPVIIESKQPMSGERFIKLMKTYPGSVSMVVPSVLQQVVSLGSDAIHLTSSAHRVIFGGAPLSQETGDILIGHGVKLMTAFGTTETGGLTLMDLPSDDTRDWQYLRFIAPNEVILKPIPESAELRQLVVKPGPYVSPDLVNHEDPLGFTTGDLWREHPTKPGMWRHANRQGFVTVLSNGEKTDNVQIETLLTKDPLISQAVVFGEGRTQNGVVVLPKVPSVDPESFLDSIWPTIEHANTIIPQHSRLMRPLVLVADPGKGFSLTDKGTVDRKRTVALYEEEIAASYSRIEVGVTSYPPPDKINEKSILEYIRKVVFATLGRFVDDNTDLFNEGMDSFLAITCRSSLMPIFKAIHQNYEVPRNLLYLNPSIDSLVRFASSSSTASDSEGMRDGDKIDAIVEKFSTNWPERHVVALSSNAGVDRGLIIVLTGSTGTFGSHVLSELLRDGQVSEVICLNRRNVSVPISDRQGRNMDDPALLLTYKGKITLCDFDPSASDLALSASVAEKIQATATHVIHCAWDVNFNHGLDRFVDSQIAGVRRLIELCLSSRRAVPPRFIFLSSISAVARFKDGEAVPEKVFDDSSVSAHQGYGRAKHISERILAKASAMAGLPVTILRIGQLSGSSKTGAWNMNEYIPVLIQSSLALRMIPDKLPDVRWIPTNIASGIVLDITRRDDGCDLKVYHIESPYLIPGENIEWLSAVHGSTSPEVTARKLEAFYRFWLSEPPGKALSVEKTSMVSRGLGWGPISIDDFSKYFEFIQNASTRV